MRGFAHARKIRLFPLETENGENNLYRLRIFLGSRRFSPSLSFSFPYRLWWRYEGSVIAIINRAGVQRCRSTSRAIVPREQWRDRSHPRRRSIFIESSPAPPSLFPLTARFYRRYSTWCGKRFGTRLDRCSKGWVRAPLASRRSKTLCSPGGVGRRRINQDRQLCKWLQTLPLFPVPAFYSAALPL